MSAMTNYLEGELIKHLFRTGTFAKPATIAIALFTSDPGENVSGAEVTGNGYARAQLAPSDTNWAAPVAGNGVTSNNSLVTFATPTGPGWGTITHFGIFDATSGGNMLLYGALTTPKTINADDVVTLANGQLTVTFA